MVNDGRRWEKTMGAFRSVMIGLHGGTRHAERVRVFTLFPTFIIYPRPPPSSVPRPAPFEGLNGPNGIRQS